MNIMFTREMSEAELGKAIKLGINPISRPLIGFEFVGWDVILSEHPDFWEELGVAKAVVFTSKNGVRGVAGWTEIFTNDHPDLNSNRDINESGDALSRGSHLSYDKKVTNGVHGELSKTIDTKGNDNLSSANISTKFIEILKKKPVYTVGESTADELEPSGILARFPDDYNATTLAKMMLMDGVHSKIIHFCGDFRRPELGLAMKDAGIDVYEVIVYKKKELNPLNPKITASIDGVVFYSPSAVMAFFEQKLNEKFEGKWFAIGQTTASALRELGIEPLVPRAPTSELMIEYVAKHLDKVN